MPSPQWAANGWRCWALMIDAKLLRLWRDNRSQWSDHQAPIPQSDVGQFVVLEQPSHLLHLLTALLAPLLEVRVAGRLDAHRDGPGLTKVMPV